MIPCGFNSLNFSSALLYGDILRSIRDFHEHGARSIGYIDHQSQQQNYKFLVFHASLHMHLFVKVYFTLFIMPIHICTGARFPS